MKYMGSKNRIAKDILPIIIKNRKEKQYYVEPFCGGLGTADKISGNILCSDKNKYLISMWIGLQKNEIRPKIISKEMYNNARFDFNNNSNDYYNDFLIGWIDFMASYNGRFFDGGYSGVSCGRNYIDEQIRNTEKQIDKIKHINFIYGDYSLIQIPEKSIIYCDIPYLGTKQYLTSLNFNYNKFYKWCLDMKNIGHEIYISEYFMPSELFNCIWSKKITNSMNTKNTYNPIEKIYTPI